MNRFADACHEVGTRPCGVTVLTSKTQKVCLNEFGAPPKRKVTEYMEILLDAGFTDAVCSPEEVRAIRQHAKFNGIDLHTPGVRLAGGDTQDQARVATPATVLADGGTTMVVGRPLTNGVPSKNWKVWMDVINAARAA